VWNWFQNRRHAQKAKIEKSKAVAAGGEAPPPPAPKAVTMAGTSTSKFLLQRCIVYEVKALFLMCNITMMLGRMV
jgi:hypothetical protein